MDYDKAVALALRLIKKNGRPVSVQRLSAGSDTAQPWKGAGAPTVAQSVSTVAVFLPASGSELGRFLVSEELLKRVEEFALVPGNKIDLTQFHQLERDSEKLKFDWIKELKPAKTSVLYAFGMKR